MRKGIGSRAGRIAAPVLLCLILFFSYACASGGGGESTAICGNDEYADYPDVLPRLLPTHTVRRAENNVFAHLEEGAVVEAFDPQAVPAVKAGLARYWYPQYLATVVIAVDRGRTDAQIRGWRDLLATDTAVGFSDANINSHMLMAAMAYGLEGGGFTLKAAAGLLSALQTQKRLARNSFAPPVVICYDYQAAALRRAGRDIELVVPEEGTLTYEKGLLSNKPLAFAEGAESLLYAAGLRLPDGRCDPALYGSACYRYAARVADYEHLNAACQDVVRVLRRTVYRIRLYTSVDGREHQLLALLYMILVVVWTAAVIRRAMQKGARRAALATGNILLGWMAVRLIKYQLIFAVGLDRYLWYGFYLFQLALSLALLWLAWAIDQPEDKVMPPKWLGLLGAGGGALAALVFTNDLHNQVFRLEYAPNGSFEYTYGPGYYVVAAACIGMVLAAIVMMLLKSGRNPRRNRFVFPLAMCALSSAYGAGYLLRVPLAWESDVTMVTGLFTLLFVETAIRTGMIPVNSKYTPLFTHSPLAMQIIDNNGNVVLSSSSSAPLRRDGDTLLFTAPIAGGHAMWQEDIAALNRLHREIEEYARKLAVANTMLAEEARIKRAMEEENAKTQLMAQLESELAAHAARLSAMIESQESAARIALLLCYIKRRCNLFFRGRETQLLPADELTVYIDELAELAGYADIKIIATSQLETPVAPRRAALFYDFFHSVVDWAAGCACPHMLAHIGPDQAMRLLPSEDARAFQLEENLAVAIAIAGGMVTVKDLDGAVGISLFFPSRICGSIEGGGS